VALIALTALPAQAEEEFQIEQLLEFDFWTDQFLPTAIRIVVIIVIALVFRAFIFRAINRLVKTAVEHQDSSGVASTREQIIAARKAQRATTLGKLFKNITSVVVLGLMSLLVLGELGVNLAPLIAAAGVVGLAIGFGAQALVQDMVSGIFILLEDQYGVGDVVDVGDATGTVEEVQLRVTKLRSIDGTLWFVRNGEILRVGNMSQDFSKVVLDIGIGYGSDLDEAKAVLERVAQEFADHPETQDVLETPEVLGVQMLGADSVIIRLTLTTKPGEQWTAARSLQERIKKAFDENGIEIPFPQRTIWLRREGEDEEAPADV
jgi:small-conductance mechanosensitive channel